MSRQHDDASDLPYAAIILVSETGRYWLAPIGQDTSESLVGAQERFEIGSAMSLGLEHFVDRIARGRGHLDARHWQEGIGRGERDDARATLDREQGFDGGEVLFSLQFEDDSHTARHGAD